jgi:hypothetical protein
MALPLVMACNNNDKNATAKTIATIIAIVYFVLIILAIYLAIRDMQYLPHMSTKIWVFALAFFLPELYVLLHGISSSAQGVNFFSGAPIPSSMMPSSPGESAMSMMPEQLTPTPSSGLSDLSGSMM